MTVFSKSLMFLTLGYALLVIVLQSIFAFVGREKPPVQEPLQSRSVISGVREIFYVRTEPAHETTICFIPGSPGKWSHFKRYLLDDDLRRHADLISIDRPGLGQSSVGGAESSLQRQAEAVAAVLQQEEAAAWVVGHSYGGSVAARLAMDNPELVKGLILIAAAVSPDHEKRRWYNHLADWRLVQWLLPRSLVISNREMKPLENELEAIRNRWKEFKVPVIVMHGENDSLVPFEHVTFLETVTPTNPLMMVINDPEWNHFIPWNQYKVVKDLLMKLVIAPTQ